MSLSTVALCLLVAFVTICNAQEPTSWAITYGATFSYAGQQRARKVLETVIEEFPENMRCEAWTKGFARSLGRSGADVLEGSCGRIPWVPPTTKGFFHVPKGYNYMHLYVVKDKTNYILAAPTVWA